MDNTELKDLTTKLQKLAEEGVIEKAEVRLDKNGKLIKNSLKLEIKESNIGELSRSLQKQKVPKALSILHKNNAIIKNSSIVLSLIEDELILYGIKFEAMKDSKIITDFLKSEDNSVCELGLTLKEFLQDLSPNKKHPFYVWRTIEGKRNLALINLIEGEERYVFADTRVDISSIAKKAKSRTRINRLKKIFSRSR